LCGKPLQNIISAIMLSLHAEKVLTAQHKEVLAKIILSQSIRVPTVFERQLERSGEIVSSYKDDFIAKKESKCFTKRFSQINGINY
jgi:hypothetical protein